MRRSSTISIGLAAALALMGGSPRASAAATGPEYGEDELVMMYQIAVQELDSREDRCVVRDGALMADSESERAFARSALMVRLFVTEYPFPPGSEAERSALVHRVVVGYERAFDCDPAWDKRSYLTSALSAIDKHLERVREIEKRPLTEPDVVAIIQDRKRVQMRLDGLRQPVCPTKEQLCPVDAEPDPRPKIDDSKGYRRWIDRLSLRLEIGGGKSNYQAKGDEPLFGSTFALHLSPGVRFLAGRNRRHVFVVGFMYGFEAIHDGATSENLHTMIARLEYGIRIHPRWFSIHGALEGGVGAGGDDPLGRGVIGSSGALCTWGEALCARIRHHWAEPQSTEMAAVVGLIGLDFFRVVDHFKTKGESQ